MKLVKTIMKTAGVLLAASMLFCSCQSTKTAEPIPVQSNTDYSDASSADEVAVKVKSNSEVTDEVVSESEDSANNGDYYDENDSDSENPNKNSFLAFLTKSSSKFSEVGTFSLSTTGLNAKLKLQEGSYYIDNKNYDAGFGSYIMAAYYVMLMDQKTRSVYINAVNSYLSDFENKKLKRKDRKTYKQYGKSKATIYWGVIKSQTSNYGYPVAYFGYTFKDKSPYFTITMHPTVNEKRRVDDTVVEESMMVTFYFTKAQCRELADFLKEDNLNNYFASNIPNVEIVTDEY